MREDIQLLDDKKIFYTAGVYVVKYSMGDKTQTFFGNKEDYHAITAIGISKQTQNRYSLNKKE